MKTISLILLLFPLLALAQFNPGKYQTLATLQAVDPEASEVVWSITAGNTGGFFMILPCTGVVKVDTAAYAAFKLQKTWSLTFSAADSEGLYSKTVRKITLKKTSTGVKLPPVISNGL